MIPIHKLRLRESYGQQKMGLCLDRFLKTMFYMFGTMAALIAVCAGAFALSAQEEVPPFNVEQWLNGPDREFFPWDVRISRPSLTFQQRYRVNIWASFNADRLGDRKIQHDIHFVLKVATEDDKWASGYSHTRVPFPPRADTSTPLWITHSLYLRPGIYTIALIACNPILNKGNVWRKRVKIAAIRGDKLPELDRNLPDIEFTTEDQLLAEGREWLPVNNNRSLCIDIVANTSMDWQHVPGLRAAGVNPMNILTVASVLSHLEPRSGSVRVSIVDTLQMKTFFNRENAADFDWQHASEVVLDQDRYTIAAELLGSQTQASEYLLSKFRAILNNDACMSGTKSPLRVVIVVSTEMAFVKHTPIRQVPSQDPASIRFFYFRLSKRISADDGLGKMLKQTKPKRYTIWESNAFRKNLADLISRLEKLAR